MACALTELDAFLEDRTDVVEHFGVLGEHFEDRVRHVALNDREEVGLEQPGPEVDVALLSGVHDTVRREELTVVERVTQGVGHGMSEVDTLVCGAERQAARHTATRRGLQRTADGLQAAVPGPGEGAVEVVESFVGHCLRDLAAIDLAPARCLVECVQDVADPLLQTVVRRQLFEGCAVAERFERTPGFADGLHCQRFAERVAVVGRLRCTVELAGDQRQAVAGDSTLDEQPRCASQRELLDEAHAMLAADVQDGFL